MIKKKKKINIKMLREVHNEIKKIVWPSFEEALHTTLVVMILIIVISIMIWSVDSIIFRVISFIINLRLKNV